MTSDDDIIYDDIFEADILHNNGIFRPQHQERELSFGSSTYYSSSLSDFTTTMSSSKTSWTKNEPGNLNIIATNNKSTANTNTYVAPPPHEQQKKDKTAAATNGTSTKKEKKYVTHHYHDFSHHIDPARRDYSRTMHSRTSDLSISLPTRRLGMANHFPIKLYHMLEHVDLHEPQLASVISWQPHGRCFKVRHPKMFEEILLQRFFKHHKYTSFQRQLNIYGFRRITSGEDRGSYYHELFLRGKKHLCYNMERTSVKGNGGRMAANPKSEPNFYAMPYLGPHHVSEIDDDVIISNIPFQTNSSCCSSSSAGRRMTNQELPVTNASPICTKHDDRNKARATVHVNSNNLSGGGNAILPRQQNHHNYHQQQQHATNENAYQNVYPRTRQNGDSSVFTQNDFYL